MDTWQQRFRDEIERLRVAAGTSKSRLARETGMSRQTLLRKLRGESAISLDEAWAICRALNANLDDLLRDISRDDGVAG